MKKTIAFMLMVAAVLLCLAGCKAAENAAVTDTAYPDPVEHMDGTALVGDYADVTSQRAFMRIDYDAQAKVYTVEVRWSSSAWEAEEWKLHFNDSNGDMHFYYDDCEHSTVTYDESGNASPVVHYQNGTGSFTYDADHVRVENGVTIDRFLWDGAADDNCKACVFERIP